MNAEAIRQRLDDDDLTALADFFSRGERLAPRLRMIVGGVAEGYGDAWAHVVDAAPCISQLAETLLSSMVRRDADTDRLQSEGFLVLTEFLSGTWHASARASHELSCSGATPDARVCGGLVGPTGVSDTETGRLYDGTLVASALSVAITECLDSEGLEDRDGLMRITEFMSDAESIVSGEWRRRMRRYLPKMMRNARLVGHSASTSRAKACVEAALLRGRALQQDEKDEALTFGLGSAALETVAESQPEDAQLPVAMRLGAAALGAAYGFSSDRFGVRGGIKMRAFEPAQHLEDFDRYDADHTFTFIAYGLVPLRFTWGELAPLVVLTARSACKRLEVMSMDPGISDWLSARYILLATSAKMASKEHPERTSFGRLLGFLETSPDTHRLEDGVHLHDAAPVGSFPAELTIQGRGGREMRLGAVADGHGRLVGYAGVDPLSEEFHGVPERYVYDLEGWRKGRLVDGIYRKGPPTKKMMTAPEGIGHLRHEVKEKTV